MTDRIFETFAPEYWNAGLPVIPLRQRNKMPDISQWSQFGSRMPSALEMTHWVASFPKGNIGLPFGVESGLCAIDIDTEDEALIAAILDCLPPTPWTRVGKKGMGLIYRFEGQKNFKLRGADGGMLLEFLGQGNQMVMPPSIHPDTGKPYTSNSNLWEVLDQIEYLGEDIEDKLRSLLGAKGFEIGAGGRSSPVDVVPAGERDVQMVRHAGYLARVVLGIDRSASFSLAEAISHMHHWVQTFTARVSGDAMDPDKGTAKLLEFLMKDLEKGRTMPEGWDANMPDAWREHPTVAKMFEMNQASRWDVTRARAWLSGKIAEKPDSDEHALACLWELIENVAKDDHFLERDFRVLISAILSLCGKSLGLKKSDLLIAFKEAKRGGEGSSEMENHANTARLVLEELQRAGEIRFDQGQFWQWNGSCFQRLASEDIYMFIVNNVKDAALVRTHHQYMSVVQVLERMCRGGLAQAEDRGLNFANGFVGEDLRTLDHDPKYGATFTLPFNYNRENASQCNRWFEFLHACWGHEADYAERVMALQEMFASTLFKLAPRYQRAFLLFGRAGTGKTQILEVLRAMLPPGALADLPPEKWSERFGLTDLIGCAANICGELPESGLIAGSVFKQIVEGSTIRSEFKGENGFSFTPTCAHWFASNFLPMSKDTSRGFIRRWMILDFNKPVAPEDRIDNLAEIIVAEEREAIAAWALEGLRRLLDQRGYTEPACHTKRLAQMRRINNSVQAFLEDSSTMVLDRDGEMQAREAYDQYVFHMRDLGRNQPVSFERFMQMVEDLDLSVEQRQDLTGTTEYWVQGLAKKDRKAA